MNIFKADFGEVVFNEDVPCVIWKPTKFMDSKSFRELMTAGVDFYGEKKA